MQTFGPYADFKRSADLLDDKRLGKQLRVWPVTKEAAGITSDPRGYSAAMTEMPPEPVEEPGSDEIDDQDSEPTSTASEEDTAEPLISFDPLLNTVPRLEPYEWHRRLREYAYAGARRARGEVLDRAR